MRRSSSSCDVSVLRLIAVLAFCAALGGRPPGTLRSRERGAQRGQLGGGYSVAGEVALDASAVPPGPLKRSQDQPGRAGEQGGREPVAEPGAFAHLGDRRRVQRVKVQAAQSVVGGYELI